MPNDYVTLNAVASELNEKLAGGKIRRICQPEKDEITLSVYNGRTNLILVISANPNSPRIHLTTVKKENPYAAPPLLMILRKHIGSAVIKKIGSIAGDRIIEIKFSARNEMFDDEEFYLVCELMGRYSNLILLDKNRRILDALHKLIPDEKQKRQIMIGAHYLPPEQNKPLIGDVENVERELNSVPPEEYRTVLVKKIAGASVPTAKTILNYAGEGATPRSIAEIARVFSDIYHSRYYRPCHSALPTDYYPYDYPFAETEPSEGINQAADVVYSQADLEARVKSAAKSLEHALDLAIKKAKNSIDVISQKISDESKSEEIRILAELITTNLYKIKPRDKEVTVYDYYANQERIIPLDPILRPNEYAQKLFKRYQKLKRGVEINQSLLKQNQDNLLYFEELAAQIKMAESVQDLSITEEEMRAAGLIRSAKQKQTKKETPRCMTFRKDGCVIYCGKGGVQNEYVTFKLGKENDIWLHAAKSHGAHVIISSEKKEIGEDVLLFAAEIAAYYSERRDDLSVFVDYTKRKNVRRHPAKKMGLVYYSDYKTIAVKPDAHTERKDR